MSEYKYINNVTQEVAEIRLYKRIGGADGVNGSDFANEIAYLQNKTNLIKVRINSGGGSVLDAMAIQASLMNSAVPVECYIDGLAASAAFSIAVSGSKCYMNDYAKGMIHNTVDTSKTSNQKVLDVFNESIATTLTNRSKKTTEEITSMMSKETWMSSKECLENGFIDAIISTDKKLKAPKITNAFELEAIYNEFLTPKKTSMKNINNELSLNLDNVDESAIVNAVKAIKVENEALKAKVTAFEKEKNDAIEAEKLALTNDVTAYATKLVTDKKIKEDEKAALITNASKDRASFEFIKNIYEKIGDKKEAQKIFNAADVKTGTEDRSTWNYMNWVEKDPKGLENLMNTNPEAFEALQKTAQ